MIAYQFSTYVPNSLSYHSRPRYPRGHCPAICHKDCKHHTRDGRRRRNTSCRKTANSLLLEKKMDVMKTPRYICKTSWFSQKILPDYTAVFELFTGKMWDIPSHPSVTSFARTARKQNMTPCFFFWSSLIIFQLRKTYPPPSLFWFTSLQ